MEKKLMEWCDDSGGVVLNGRMTGDSNGEFTYIDTMGKSVNDLAIASFGAVKYVESYRVLDENFSDHFPIELGLRNMKAKQNENCLELIPKLIWREQSRMKYRAELEKIINVENSSLEKHTISTLVEVVKTAAKLTDSSTQKPLMRKQRWYDWQCEKLRVKSYKLLKVFRHNDENDAKLEYLRINREFKSLCKKKKADYNENITKEIEKVKDAKQWWKLVRKLRNGTFTLGSTIKINDLKMHFHCILNSPNTYKRIEFAEPYVQSEILDANFTLAELQLVLCKAKDGKAPGSDRVPVEFYKNAPENFLARMVQVFNEIYLGGNLPSCFKESIIFPLHKKGDIQDVTNYRGISFIDSIVKVYTGVLLHRLNLWIEVLCENQGGALEKVIAQ